MSNKKLVREIASIIASHNNKDQYGNAKLAEYIIRKILRTGYNEIKMCPRCNANHGDSTCEEFQQMMNKG